MTCLPVAGFGCNPWEPAAADDVRFFDYSYDPGHRGIAARQWDFGDGAFSDERQPTHQYGADGDYTVRLIVSTPDGRLGAATTVIRVRTHQVTMASIRAPSSCVPGETVDVVVEISGVRYDEIVDIRLFVRLPASTAPAMPVDRATIAVRAVGASAPARAMLRAPIREEATPGSAKLEAVISILGALPATSAGTTAERSIVIRPSADA